MDIIEKEIVAPDGKEKVQLLRRGNGTYSFEILRWSDGPLELAWIPLGRHSHCMTAEREALGRVGWTRTTDG
jgi:hypothetical protein